MNEDDDAESMRSQFRRVLVKLGGESLCPAGGSGIDVRKLQEVARLAIEVSDLGVELALLVGGGNIVRGQSLASHGVVKRTTADSIGMLGTVINALAIEDAIASEGGRARVLASMGMPGVAELFVQRNAVRYLADGTIVIFAGGTGNPFFTTDTAAALRSVEIGAELLIKATKVDGVYAEDPLKNPDAERFSRLTYMDVIEKGLRVMDTTAITLCMENHLPVCVLDVSEKDSVVRAICGEQEGTRIEG